MNPAESSSSIPVPSTQNSENITSVSPMPVAPVISNASAQADTITNTDLVKVGFWRRFCAFFIDEILFFLFLVILDAIISAIQPGSIRLGGSAFGIWVLAVYATPILYFVLMTWKQGATLGKKAMGIRVVSVDGKPLSLIQVILREVVGKIVSGIIVYIGYLMIAWDKNKQGLHDKIASTYVVKG